MAPRAPPSAPYQATPNRPDVPLDSGPDEDAENVEGTAPLDYNRGHDKPAGAHVGPAAARQVPVSSGPSSRVLERGLEPESDVVGREGSFDPMRFMEAGTDWSDETRRRLRGLGVAGASMD
jgi:hypothetical protein